MCCSGDQPISQWTCQHIKARIQGNECPAVFMWQALQPIPPLISLSDHPANPSISWLHQVLLVYTGLYGNNVNPQWQPSWAWRYQPLGYVTMGHQLASPCSSSPQRCPLCRRHLRRVSASNACWYAWYGQVGGWSGQSICATAGQYESLREG